jgi:hypothetical protein
VFIVSIALFLAVILLFAGFGSSLAMAQQTTTGSGTTTPLLPPSSGSTGQTTSPSLSSSLTQPLTPQEQEQLNRLQNVIAATNQNLDETEKQIGGIVYTPRWSDPIWVEPDSASVLIAYCLPGEFAESGQEILGGFELEVLESYEVALPQNFTAWMMVIGNEDRQDRIPAAVGVVCASDANDAETRIASPQEQQQINNVVQQITQVTSIDQVINIINRNNNNNSTNQNMTGGAGGGTTAPPPASRDTTRPSLTIPNDMVLQTSGGSPTALLVYSVTAQDDRDGTATLDEDNQLIQGDNVGGNIFISCRPQSQYFLPVGNRIVNCLAADAVNNTAQASFIVTVRDPTSPAGSTDTIAPSLSVPVTRVIPTTSPTGEELVSYDVSATDNVDGTARLDANNMLIQEDNFAGSVAISCNPPSNTNFLLGNHTVTCSAVDAAGNRGTASFIIAVTSATTSTSPASGSGVGGITISDLDIVFLTASGPVASDTNAYNGPCPVGASISGTITDNVGNRDVTYRLIMNDGVLPEGVRHFDQPGSEIVSFGIQTLGGFNNVQSYQGWFAIEILQPVQLQSERVEFQTTCTPSTGGAPPAPQTLQAENGTTTVTTTDEEEEEEEQDTTTDGVGAEDATGGGGGDDGGTTTDGGDATGGGGTDGDAQSPPADDDNAAGDATGGGGGGGTDGDAEPQ